MVETNLKQNNLSCFLETYLYIPSPEQEEKRGEIEKL